MRTLKTAGTWLSTGVVLGVLAITGNTTAEAGTLTGAVVDADTGVPLAARVYIHDQAGQAYVVASALSEGTAVPYQKQNWINADAKEIHTAVSAHPFAVELPPGRYDLVVERGKEFQATHRSVMLDDQAVSLTLPLRRWVDMAERGWYSGDTHIHRDLSELPTAMLAEDLNVTFPLTYWVTEAFRAPTTGDKNVPGEIPNDLIWVDGTHVIWPRNTEWEIFTVGSKRFTLGAVFALGHREPFSLGVPTVEEVAQEARRQGALLDLDKHDWPWSMTLPVTMGVHLYELANNHIWRTEFAFRNWNSPTPVTLRPPLLEQSGTEREWILFTMETYYALLNCGLDMVPTAGTASGVHPVPPGFGRVYVHQPEGFRYRKWLEGLRVGRSFVTTGPMILATVNGLDPGARLGPGGTNVLAAVEGEILSEFPISFAEIIRNGEPAVTVMGNPVRIPTGAYRTALQAELRFRESGWLAIRCWEDRPDGRVRYAHTAPWHVQVPDRPQRARPEDRDYLMARVQQEIQRSRAILPDEAIREYEKALAYYRSVPVREGSRESASEPPSNLADERRTPGRVRVIPFPGGLHPRMGFLEGAIRPQRDTKITVFTPWDPESYAVVDLPEAIWSNLGLTFLAHTHIPTIWDQKGIRLPTTEWRRHEDGSLHHQRTLPNGIAFGAGVRPGLRHLEMDLWLRNGSGQPLTGLRVQNCVMLKGARGFSAQSNTNKRLDPPFAMVRSDEGARWIITTWERTTHTWANPPVPCLHADPSFPDLAPDEEGRLRGWLWFYEGDDIDSELDRLRAARTPNA